jgi:hypothetical protein
MQLSGPWPPYHFVHRLTRGSHSQTATHAPIAAGTAAAAMIPAAAMA